MLKLIVWLLSIAGTVALAQETPVPEFEVERFTVTGENPLDPVVTDEILAPFTGAHAGLEGLLAARDALQQALRSRGYTFRRVILPPQTLEGGAVTLEVLIFPLGKVRVTGLEHASEASVRRSLPGLVAGAVPDVRDISRQLAVANLHPAKTLSLNFRASETEANTLDAVVNVDDAKPWSVFAGLNNIGNKDTGRTRLTVGGLYSDVTGHDDIFTGSFTTSPDNADDVQVYGAYYQLPVYALRGWFSGFWVKSDVDVGNVQEFFDISGSGDFVGLSFRRELIGVGRYRHGFTVGIQDRAFDTAISNAVTGTAIPAISTKVRSRPVSLRYDGAYNWQATSFDFYFDFVQNMSFGGHNDRDAYRAVRIPADPDWKAIRFGALVTHRLPRDYFAVGRLTGQYTNEPLIPGEQIGVGGERSVRGFEERTIAGDKGLVLNMEVWSPPLPQIYGVRLLAFFDIGHKVLEKPLARQRPNDTISSIGVGARWQWGEALVASLDYGQPLANGDGEASDRGNSKWHFNLQYRY